MAEQVKKLVIDIFKSKNPDELTKTLSDKNGKLETGSAAAIVAANACALMQRASAICAEKDSENERLDYILRNSEILRSYMVHLIDEDVKCRGPLVMAKREGDARKIEAASQPAVAICSEIVNMMLQTLELLQDLLSYSDTDSLHYIGESAAFALSAAQAARLYIINMADKSSDETYRFVLRRENEISLERCNLLASEIISKVEAMI